MVLIEIRKILSKVTGPVTWEILRLMINKDYSAMELKEALHVKRSTVRTHLRRLRNAGFIEAKKTTRPKRYGVADSLPSPVHDLVLLFSALDESTNIYDSDQVREQLESMRPAYGESDWFENVIQILVDHYPHPGLISQKLD